MATKIAKEEKQIEKWQIKRMWAITASLGMSKDDLYAMAQVEHLHNLTQNHADTILSRLDQLQGSYNPFTTVEKRHKEVAGMITEGQQKKVWALMYELKKHDIPTNTVPLGERLCGIIERQLMLKALPQKPFVWVSEEEGNRLIEIIKNYVKNAKK